MAGATVREVDGLALSSRNAYLSPAERASASRMSGVLRDAAAALEAGAGIADVESRALARLVEGGFGPVDYVAVRSACDLSSLAGPGVDQPARVLAAAWLGKTRLIDNLGVRRP
jgi:pantoate--beta-alanine ligase